MSETPLNILNHAEARRAFTMHDRSWQQNRYVYPVVSRRSKGISIGINLNPDKACNFDCIYCSVDRRQALAAPAAAPRDIDLAALREELADMLNIIHSRELFQLDPFDKIPAPLRRINDIAFSGDGEPTTCPQFADACRTAAELKDHAGLNDLKLVLITNATMFQRPAVREVLSFLDQHQGEIWAKLDAGTADYYQLVERTGVPFARVLENLSWCCQTRPTVIQSLFMKIHGEPPPAAEIDAYVARLAQIVHTGGNLKLVQLYTVARRTTESFATPLSEAVLRIIGTKLSAKLPSVPCEVYP